VISILDLGKRSFLDKIKDEEAQIFEEESKIAPSVGQSALAPLGKKPKCVNPLLQNLLQKQKAS
jgi:hypothetical protein